MTETSTYIDVITQSDWTSFDNLTCVKPLDERYAPLRSSSTWLRTTKPKYFIALDLHQSREIIARLMSSILEAVTYLGPKHCVVSIVEGRSTDGTFEILSAARDEFSARGIEYHLVKNDELDPKAEGGNRFEVLAQLRNQVLAPLLENPSHYSDDVTVIFSNDIALCVNDILELIYQKKIQSADMACAMDYSNDGLFYDVWISRGMTGDIFWEIPPSGAWTYAKNLFWNDVVAKRRLKSKKPFQVYACWNGVVAFTGKALVQEGIRFRKSGEGECLMGEPTILCHDFWDCGFGKIMVVPSVWVAYSARAIEKVKQIEGYVEQVVDSEAHRLANETELIEWDSKPPPQVKCLIPSMHDPTWINSTTFAMPLTRGEPTHRTDPFR